MQSESQSGTKSARLSSTSSFSSKFLPCPPNRCSISSTAARRCTARTTRRSAPRKAALLRNAQGTPDQRGLHLRDDAAQAAERAQAGVHRRVVRSAGPHVPRRPRRRLQGEPRADARRARRADPDGARRVRGARRADPHLRALRSRRCDRHAGGEGRGRRLRRRDRHGDKDFFQLVARRHPRLQPARRRHVVRRGGREGEVRRRARPGRRRAGADGRHDRQHQGRARHRREGRARADRARTARSTTCSRTPPRSSRSATARRCWPTSTRRGRAASWRASAPTCRSSSTPRRSATAARSRERCFEIFNELGFRTLVARVRADRATRSPRPTASSTRPRSCARWPRGCARPGRFALRVLPDRPSAMRASIVGLAFSTAPRDADYVPIGHRGARRRSPSLPVDDRARRAASRCSKTPAIAKVGHDLKFDAIVLARHGVDAARARLDTMLASYLLDATRSEHRLEDLALEHTSYKALTEEDVCGRGAKARVARPTCRSRRRSTSPASAPTSPGSWRRCFATLLDEGAADRGLPRRSSCRSIPVLVASSAPACASTPRRSPRSRRRIEQELRAADGADLRAGRRRVQHQLAEAARGSPVRQAAAAGAQADRHVAGAVDRRRSARGAGARARPAAA